MLQDSAAFSGFSVNDLALAKGFYEDVLGLEVSQDEMGLHLHIAGSNDIFVYEKEDHQPATFTVLNFPVEDIDQAAEELATRGVAFEHYDGMYQGEDGIARGKASGDGPDIAWFKDPAGNILSILSN